MDFQGLIEFNKYTIALAAAGFAYTLEKFSPMPTAGGRWLLLGVLGLFLVSAIFGVVVFAGATAALGNDEKRKRDIRKYLPWLGTTHAILLCVALLVVGGMLVNRVLTEPLRSVAPNCCCDQVPGAANR